MQWLTELLLASLPFGNHLQAIYYRQLKVQAVRFFLPRGPVSPTGLPDCLFALSKGLPAICRAGPGPNLVDVHCIACLVRLIHVFFG